MRHVRRLAAEYPTAVYRRDRDLFGCRYTSGTVENGPPDGYGCLIGQAILAGYPETGEKLRSIDSRGECAASDLLREHTSAGWLAQVQLRQDVSLAWGEAVQLAASMYPSVAANDTGA